MFSIRMKRWFDLRGREEGKWEGPSWNYILVKFWSEWNRLKVIFWRVSTACVVQSSAPFSFNRYTLFDGFTDNTRGYFTSCVVWEQRVKCPRVLSVIPSNVIYFSTTLFPCHFVLFYSMSDFKPGCYSVIRLLQCNTLSHFTRSLVLIW